MRVAIFLVCWVAAGCASGPTGYFSARKDDDGNRGFAATLAAVVPVAEAICRQKDGAQNCDFRIVIDNRPGQPPNAFQSLGPSGQPVLTFTAALVAQTHNDDERALIIAHEAAHHIAGHIGQQMRRLDGGPVSRALLLRAVAAADGNKIDIARFGLMPAGPEVSHKAFELEADQLGAEIAALAGFDPARAAELFHRIPDPVQHSRASHPTNAERHHAVMTVAGAVPS
jgi:predicted Zn-dependent protease